MLSDNSTYIMTSNDPTTYVKDQLKIFFEELVKNTQIDKNSFSNLYNKYLMFPLLNFIPNIHKPHKFGFRYKFSK